MRSWRAISALKFSVGATALGDLGISMAEAVSLKSLWQGGREGNLSPLEQVRAVALRDAYLELGAVPKLGGQAALLRTIVGKVTKVGGGHPSKEAIRPLLERYDAGPSGWFPGKSARTKFGPSPALNKAKR